MVSLVIALEGQTCRGPPSHRPTDGKSGGFFSSRRAVFGGQLRMGEGRVGRRFMLNLRGGAELQKDE